MTVTVKDTSHKASTPTAPTPETGAVTRARQRRNTDPWRSGFCGPGPCRDGATLTVEGTPKHYCRAVCENGVKVTPRYLYCACECHRTNPNAVQMIEVCPDFNPDETDDAGDAAAA